MVMKNAVILEITPYSQLTYVLKDNSSELKVFETMTYWEVLGLDDKLGQHV